MNKTPKQIMTTQGEQLNPIQDEAQMLISQAINKGVPVETMEKLLAMRRELKQEKAKEEFNRAMAKFQSDCPTIQKTKEVIVQGKVAYRYAPIESIVDQIKQALNDNGFSYSTSMDLLSEGVKVCVKVTHATGHSEETCMTVPLGNKTGIMSNSQQVAAATTFAKRYAFCNAFGILTGDEDNDGANIVSEQKVAPRPTTVATGNIITDKQRSFIFKLLTQKGKTEVALHKLIKSLFNKESLTILTQDEASKVIEKLLSLPEVEGNAEDSTSAEEVLNYDEIDKGIEGDKKE